MIKIVKEEVLIKNVYKSKIILHAIPLTHTEIFWTAKAFVHLTRQ